MKTTFDIDDSLLTRAKKLAKQKNMTLRSLVEEGLRHSLHKHRSKEKKTLIQPHIVTGNSSSGDKPWAEICKILEAEEVEKIKK